jgi:hypothetical protein
MLIRRMPTDWSELSQAELRAWCIGTSMLRGAETRPKGAERGHETTKLTDHAASWWSLFPARSAAGRLMGPLRALARLRGRRASQGARLAAELVIDLHERTEQPTGVVEATRTSTANGVTRPAQPRGHPPRGKGSLSDARVKGSS